MSPPLRQSADPTVLASVQGLQLALLSNIEGEYTSYVWKNLIVSVWVGPTTLSGLLAYEQQFKRTYERWPKGVSSLNLVKTKHRVPEPDVRRELTRFTREYMPRTAAVAIILQGGGFMASAMRGVVTALMLVGPPGFKLNVFGGVSEVAHWLPPIHMQRTGVTILPNEVAALITSVEHAHAQASGAL